MKKVIRHPGLKKIIKLIVAITVVVYLLHILETRKLTVVDTVLFSIVAFAVLMIMLYTIIEFVKFVFIRTEDYTFDNSKEHTFAFTALICFMACSFIEKNSFASDFFMSVIMNDLVKMVACSYWYFCVIFFPISLLFIVGHKRTIYKQELVSEDKGEKIHISDLKLKRPNKKANYNTALNDGTVKCIIFKLYDAIVSCIIDGIEALIKTILVLISIPYSIIVSTTRWIKRKLSFDLGKSLIICSRFSLVVGLIIVFLIDKYYSLFSDAGSRVFEFCCSVIIIPLLITHLTELRNRV